MSRILLVTGTDTGVGKTVLTALLARSLGRRGVKVAALKPVSSGDRADARALRAALNRALTLEQINPWHFQAPVAPLLAARHEHRRLALGEVVDYVRAMARRFDTVLVEGAGGLLSPIGEGFDSRDLMAALRAAPIVVGPDRLGAVNQVLLTLEALSDRFRSRARIVLMALRRPDVAARTNADLLAELAGGRKIFTLPWLGRQVDPAKGLQEPRVRRTLGALARA